MVEPILYFEDEEEQSQQLFNMRIDGGEEFPQLTFQSELVKEPELDLTGTKRLPVLFEKPRSIEHSTLGFLRDNLDFIPFAKYAREEDRAEFEKLDSVEKAKALAWETLGLGLWVAGGAVVRGAAKGVKVGAKLAGKGVRKLRPIPKLKPIEDLGSWTAENYHGTASRYLEKNYKWKKDGLKSEEIGAVVQALQGRDEALKEAILALPGKNSKQFLGMIENKSGIPYVQYQLNKGTLKELVDYTPRAVRKQHLLDDFKKAMQKKQILGKKVYDPVQLDALFKVQAKRYFGAAGAKGKTLATATEQELWNFTKNILNSPAAVKDVNRLIRPGGLRYLNVVRRVYGKAEDTLGTHSGIYVPVKKAFGQTNEYTGMKVEELQRMLTQLGYMKKTKRGYKRTSKMSDPIVKWTHWKMGKADDIMGQIGKSQDPVTEAGLRRMLETLDNRIPKDVDVNEVNGLIETLYSFFDKTYGERFAWKIGDMFDKAGLTPMGRAMSERFRNDLYSRLRYVMSTSGSQNYTKRVNGMKEIFGDVKKMLGEMKAAPATSWFKDRGAETLVEGPRGTKIHWLDEFAERFKFSKNGDFFPYLENYLPRLYEGEMNATGRIFGGLGGKQRAFYTQSRKSAEAIDERLGLEQLIHSRVRAQAKEIFLYDELQKVSAFAKNLPESWRNYTEQYFARILNVPSRGDEWAADWILDPTLGALERLMGRERVWDARRVMRLSQNVNDITYMGFLGLKPFSAMRNLFQPLILVPADLGGNKNLYHLARGYRRGLLDPEGRSYLNSIGIITDYAPELRRVPRIFKTRTKVKGVPLPLKDEIRDVMMWMFQGSDKWNRYVTGGAAMSKWESALTKSGLNQVRADKFLNPDNRTKTVLNKFMGQAGINGRHPWVKAELEATLKSGRLDEAKAMFVRDVVSDTQFLYGGLDAPLWSHVGGFPTRTAAIFQSWWLNYGGLAHKWLTTGEKSEKLSKMLGWALPQAIAFTAMKQMWGVQTARRSTFFGPFPTSETFLGVPPTWDPILEVLDTASTMANVAFGAEDPEAIGKQLKALGWKTFSFVPAGLQLKQFYRGYEKEGAEGALKAIIRYKPPKG